MEINTTFLSFLKNHLSINGKILSNESIAFRYNDLNFVFRYNDKGDSNFFQIILPDIFPANDSSREHVTALNRRIKVAKGIILPTDEEGQYSIWISCEQFVYSEDGLNPLFFRMISVLTLYYNDFRNLISQRNER